MEQSLKKRVPRRNALGNRCFKPLPERAGTLRKAPDISGHKPGHLREMGGNNACIKAGIVLKYIGV